MFRRSRFVALTIKTGFRSYIAVFSEGDGTAGHCVQRTVFAYPRIVADIDIALAVHTKPFVNFGGFCNAYAGKP